MKKESAFYNPLTPPEKKFIRRSALWMFGLMAAGCLALACLLPIGYQVFPPEPLSLLIIGGVTMALAVPFHLLAGAKSMQPFAWRRLFYIPAVLLNLIGISLFEAIYYTSIGSEPPPGDLLAGAWIPAGVCLLALLCVCIWTEHLPLLSLIFAGLEVAGIIACIVFWVMAGVGADSILWSFALFNLVGTLMVSGAFLYAASDVSELCGKGMPVETVRETDAAWGWLRFLSFASFGLFLIVGVVVVLILMLVGGDGCDCDCGDGCCRDGCCQGCDCSGGHSGRKKPKNPPS